MKGKIYMLPVTLGNPDESLSIPVKVKEKTLSLRLFAVEDVRSARRYLRGLDKDFPIDDTLFFDIGKHSNPEDLNELFKRVVEGADAGVMSEAGMPGLADPGNHVVAEAHKRGIRVLPLTGPSSIMLALVGSGLNGQYFAFHGYLPSDAAGRQKAIKALERDSITGQTQIFMETPFRTDKMLNDIDSESIRTKTISEWKNVKPSLDNRQVVFLLLA